MSLLKFISKNSKTISCCLKVFWVLYFFRHEKNGRSPYKAGILYYQSHRHYVVMKDCKVDLFYFYINKTYFIYPNA